MITHLSIACVLLLSTVTNHDLPPQPDAKTVSQGNGTDKNSQVRQNATLVLDAVIDELRQIDDVAVRVDLADPIVKSLSASRPDRCHQLLDSLFHEVIQLRSVGSAERRDKAPNPDSLIRKIIGIAATFNPKLAKSYIEKYTSEEASTNARPPGPNDALRAAVLQLKLATELVKKDVALAVLAGSQSLRSGVLPATLLFLGKLQKKDPALARNFFTAALQSIKARHGNNVNELLLLYAFLFSPSLVPQVTPQGLARLSLGGYPASAEKYTVDSTLARRYLNVSARMFFKPARYQQSLAFGAAGDLYLMNLLEPQLSIYLPELVQPLSERRYILLGQLNPDQRNSLQAATDRWNDLSNKVDLRPEPDVETVEFLLRRADRLTDPVLKNRTYYRAAMDAVEEKQYEMALEIVGKLSREYREEAKQFISFSIAASAAHDHELGRAEQMARRDDDLARRAYVFTVIAGSLLDDSSMNVARARQLLYEVEQIAPKLSDWERLSVLSGCSNLYSRFDIARADELLREAIGTANKLDGFTGVNYIVRILDIGGYYFSYSMYAGELTFIDAINRMGLYDFDRTLQEVRKINSNLPRLKAIVALCSQELSKSH